MSESSNTIYLTVQSNGSGGYRLGINSCDSKEIFKKRKQCVILKLGDLSVPCKTACGVPNWYKKKSDFKGKKGYDLNNKCLSKWIIDNRFCCYQKGHPIRLPFSCKIDQKESQFVLEFMCDQFKYNEL